jgi:hypothetical protein
MRTWIVLLILLFTPSFVSAQLYPSQPPLLGPMTPNAYGPGIGMDGTGRPFYWQAPGQPNFPDPTIQPRINQYGFGSSADQYGRFLEPRFPQEQERPAFGPGNIPRNTQEWMEYLDQK